MNTKRRIIVGVTMIIFLVGSVISFNIEENAGTSLFSILIIGLALVFVFTIAAQREKPTIPNDIQSDITYRYYRTDVVPAGTVVITILSLLWLLISKMQEAGASTALGFFIGFGLLALIELSSRWWKVTKYNGFTFLFNSHGIVMAKGSWTKEYPWSNYTGFSTVYAARFGRWVRYIPYASMFVHETDQNLINLYRQEEYRHEREWDPIAGQDPAVMYDRIGTLPKNHQQVVDYIKQHLPESKKLSLNERL